MADEIIIDTTVSPIIVTVSPNYQKVNYISKTNYLGSSCTGSSGDLNRTLVHTKDLTNNNLIIQEHLVLTESIDYTVSTYTITFLTEVFDTQSIVVMTQAEAITKVNYLGSACSGSSGDLNRTLVHSEVIDTNNLVIKGGLVLVEDVDYTVSSKTITFLIEIFDAEYITVMS